MRINSLWLHAQASTGCIDYRWSPSDSVFTVLKEETNIFHSLDIKPSFSFVFSGPPNIMDVLTEPPVHVTPEGCRHAISLALPLGHSAPIMHLIHVIRVSWIT